MTKTQNRTKIVATVGPAISKPQVLEKLIRSGVNVFRLNFSHGTHEEHKAVIDAVQQLNKKLGVHVGLLADLQGPKIRIGEMKDGSQVLEDGKKITITTKKCISSSERLYITYDRFAHDVEAGNHVLIDDGKIELVVLTSNQTDTVEAKIIHGGQLHSRKGVNLPNTLISVPSLTTKDKEDLRFLMDQEVQWIALSFVRKADDIRELKGILGFHNQRMKVVAKIERPEALQDLDAIVRATDGVMIARGDLGVEVPMEQIPIIQKRIVNMCLELNRPVIIATQMMESMITNSRPTRAEITDVANGVIDGADAVMLSAETSVGKFPVITVQTMARIIQTVEEDAPIYNKFKTPDQNSATHLSDAICLTACELAQNVGASAIMGMTRSGYTAFRVSAYRPKSKIFIFTDDHQVIRSLSMIWGVQAFHYDRFESTDHTIGDVQDILCKKGLVCKGEIVINLGSMPLSERGKTNMLKISVIR